MEILLPQELEMIVLYYVQEIYFYSGLIGFFSAMDIEFYTLWAFIDFPFLELWMRWIILIDFCILNSFFIPKINHTWSWYILLKRLFWIWFVGLLSRIFASIFMHENSQQFTFWAIFIFFDLMEIGSFIFWIVIIFLESHLIWNIFTDFLFLFHLWFLKKIYLVLE